MDLQECLTGTVVIVHHYLHKSVWKSHQKETNPGSYHKSKRLIYATQYLFKPVTLWKQVCTLELNIELCQLWQIMVAIVSQSVKKLKLKEADLNNTSMMQNIHLNPPQLKSRNTSWSFFGPHHWWKINYTRFHKTFLQALTTSKRDNNEYWLRRASKLSCMLQLLFPLFLSSSNIK